MLTMDKVPALVEQMQGVVIHGRNLGDELAQFHSSWLSAPHEEKQQMEDATVSVATIFHAAYQLNRVGGPEG